MAAFKQAIILLADEHNFDREQRHGSIGAMYRDWLRVWRPKLACTCYKAHLGELPKQIDTSCLYLITGSRYSAYEDQEWIHQLTAFVRQLFARKAPLLGICFGHQLIAQALGGKVSKAMVGWGAGVQEYKVANSSGAPSMPVANFSSLVQHQDQVEQMPPDSSCLAGNDFCPLGVLQYHQAPILSLQCHPEFSKELAREIINARFEAMSRATSEHALASLEQEVNVQPFSNWALDYLERYVD